MQVPFSRVWSEELTDLSRRWTVCAGWKKQRVNSTFSSKHKTQTRTRVAIWLWGASPVLKSNLAPPCRLTAQGNPRHPYEATCHRGKGWGPSLPGWVPAGALYLLPRGKERTEQAAEVLSLWTIWGVLH